MEIRIINKLREKRGSLFPLTLAIALALFIIIAGISEYLRLKVIASGIKDAVQSAVVSVSVENFDNIYSPVREGYSGAYKYNDEKEDWKEIIDVGDVYDELDNLLGLEVKGGYHIKKSGSDYEYKLSRLDVTILNTPIATNNIDDKFSAETLINLEVPLSFGWEHLPPMKIRLKVKSEYMAKF